MNFEIKNLYLKFPRSGYNCGTEQFLDRYPGENHDAENSQGGSVWYFNQLDNCNNEDEQTVPSFPEIVPADDL